MSDREEEENTRWVEVWALNSVDYYDELQRAARVGPDALCELVERLWKNAPEDSTEYYQAREMTPGDYHLVDWEEVARTLTD